MPALNKNGKKPGVVSRPVASQPATAKFGAVMKDINFGRNIILTLVGVLLVYGVFYLGTLIQNNLKEYHFIGKTDRSERIVTFSGYAKVNARNDIAVTTIGYSNTDEDVSEAQAANSKVVNAIIADLKALGIAEKDMTSNYSIFPEYDYSADEGRIFRGYKVNNQVTVKIRDLQKIQSVLSLAGKHDANQVSGLRFTIDDTESLKEQARVKALADAQQKAEALAKALGVRLLGVTSYNEFESGRDYPIAARAYEDIGLGGAVAAPTVTTGSRDVEMNVSVSYEIAPLR